MKKVLLPLLLCLLLPCSALAAAADAVPKLNLSGLTDLLAKNKGKVVMLNFFATWCPPCRMEIPELVKMHKKYEGKDVVIISLSVDEKPEVKPPFVRSMGMDQFCAVTVGRDITRAFQVSSIPTMLFTAKTVSWCFRAGVADGEIMVCFKAVERPRAHLPCARPAAWKTPAMHGLLASARQACCCSRALIHLYGHVSNFMVAADAAGRTVGCCALAPVWEDLAEIRSFGGAGTCAVRGVGRSLVRACLKKARLWA